ncbi:3-hydroxy-3-methylglutaryl coenzyme A reductase 1-like [Bidens hawaiensis]|uniref:3-hydroxy-3-methylglutaryl coenzyme A reductase 1-like n=2 Tax=Bidens hawaiensis TaxID=980011 RepID=UPI00404A3A55
MDLRRRLPPKPPSITHHHNNNNNSNNNNINKPNKPITTVTVSDALPLPLYLTNGIFFTLFFSVSYFLLHRWREKIRSSTPLHVVTVTELTAIVSLIASFIYLLGFFGINYVQPIVENDVVRHSKPKPTIIIPKSSIPTSLNPKLSIPRSLNLVKSQEIDKFAIPRSLNLVKFQENEEIVKLAIPRSMKSEADEKIVNLVISGAIPSYSLESNLGDCRRAAGIRREAVERKTGKSLVGLPLEGFDYESILGQCCEMPIGYVQLPVGIVGPLLLNGSEYMVPMATTEGCLVASTNRGCKAVFASGGATAVLLKDGMTRAPVVRFGSAARAAHLKFFLEDRINFDVLSIVFNKSSRFARLQSIQCSIAGKNLYIRFTCSTGDAMGMNMVSKGVQNVLDFLRIDFPDMDVIGISGNFCSDKKPAAVNWIEGRGKSVVCEAVITEEVVKKVLKTTVPALVELNMLKNLAGSAVAGSLGGFNAHAANIVSAIFIATGQDPAQNIESSHCITMMEAVNGGKDLHISVTMPSIEVGTVGGGTQLASQAACLNLLGVKGASKESPGSNARLLATIVAGSVLAGELSLMSAISAGQLVKSHLKYNRSNQDMTAIAS